MSNWIKGPGGVFKRQQGLYVHTGAAAPVVVGNLRPTFASMAHAAVYQADFPGVGELGGTFDPATAGANVTLSNGNLTATFAGTGSVLASVNVFSVPANYVAWEFVFSGAWTHGGFWPGNNTPYNSNALLGGGATDCMRYIAATGALLGTFSAPDVGPVLAAGDVVGCVWNAAGGANAVTVYVNGILVNTADSMPSGGLAFPILSQA